MTKINSRGFGAIEGLLIVIALTLIVGVGAYVLNVNKQSKSADKTSTDTNQVVAKKTETPKTTEYKNEELGLKLTYPTDWGVPSLAKGPLVSPQSGDYRQLTFSKASKVAVNFVIGAYGSPLDGCDGDPVFRVKHGLYSLSASTIGWKEGKLIHYYTGQGFDGPTVYEQNLSTDGYGNEKVKVSAGVLEYRGIDNSKTSFKAVSGTEAEACGEVTQAQADEANTYYKFTYFAHNYSNTKTKGVNAWFDARQGDDKAQREQVIEVLASVKSN